MAENIIWLDLIDRAIVADLTAFAMGLAAAVLAIFLFVFVLAMFIPTDSE